MRDAEVTVVNGKSVHILMVTQGGNLAPPSDLVLLMVGTFLILTSGSCLIPGEGMSLDSA